MPVPEPLLVLLGELEAMAPADRAAILGALSRHERALLDRLAIAGGPQGTGMSPWLAAHVDAARGGASLMTPSAREALLRAVGVPMREPRPAGRSLVGAFSGLLATRGAR